MKKRKTIIVSYIVAGLLLLALPVVIIFNLTGSELPKIVHGEATPEMSIIPVAFTVAPTALGDITITALNSTRLGVEVDSVFLIDSNIITFTKEHLYSYLSIRSGESFALEEQSSNSFLLRF